MFHRISNAEKSDAYLIRYLNKVGTEVTKTRKVALSV